MNFKNWLLNESKTITLPPEVLSFIDEITPEITKLMLDSKEKRNGCSEIRELKKKWITQIPIKSKYYDKFDYEISGVKYRKNESYFPVTVVIDCNLNKSLGHFDRSNNEVKVNSFFWGKQQNGSNGTEISIKNVKGLLIHEFIHAVDVKLHDEKVRKGIWSKHGDAMDAPNKSIDKETNDMYMSNPTEIDANTGTITQRIISYANESNDHNKTIQDLEKILDFIKNIEKYRNANIVLNPLISRDVVKIYKYIDMENKIIKQRVLSRIYDAVMEAKKIIQQKQRIE